MSVELDGKLYPGRLYKRTSRWWYHNGPVRVSTKTTDKLAAKMTVRNMHRNACYSARSVAVREAVFCSVDVDQQPRLGWVYFIASDSGFIKIGHTVKMAVRFNVLNSGSPTPLELLGVVPGGTLLESAILSFFVAHKARGEWIRDTPAAREFINTHCDPIDARRAMVEYRAGVSRGAL